MQSLNSSACYDEIKATDVLLVQVIQHAVQGTLQTRPSHFDD